MGHDSRLLLIAADQPGRGQFAGTAGEDALLDRGALLQRLARALGTPGVDGVVATTDILDDLLLLESLEERIGIGVMNSGGLDESAFSLADRFTGFDADVLAASHLDGGKLRVLIDPSDAGTLRTLEEAGRAITALATHGVLAVIETGWVARDGGAVSIDTSARALGRAMGVVAALGSRSPYSWLLMPAVDSLPDALSATTLPVLVRLADLPAPGEPELIARLLNGPGVRGVVIPATRLDDADPELVERLVNLIRSDPEHPARPGD